MVTVRILLAYTFVPFSSETERTAADRLADGLRTLGVNVAISALPIDPDPRHWVEQCLWIRLLQLDPFADRLICLGTPAVLLRHRDKRVWLAHQFDHPTGIDGPQVSYDTAIREARVVACEPGHRDVGRKGVVPLTVPAVADSWHKTSLALMA